MEENCIGSRSPQQAVVFKKKKMIMYAFGLFNDMC
jgi:hypothetical protein